MYRPEIFKDDLNERVAGQQENETDTSDDDDGLPPLEANTNRLRPFEPEDSESDSDHDDHFVASHSSTKTL